MKIRSAFLLTALAVIHFALFITHANTSVYLWLIDLLIVAICLLFVASNYVASINRKKPKRKPPKAAYSQLSIPDLLKALQNLNEQERLIESELELRYTVNNLRRA